MVSKFIDHKLFNLYLFAYIQVSMCTNKNQANLISTCTNKPINTHAARSKKKNQAFIE